MGEGDEGLGGGGEGRVAGTGAFACHCVKEEMGRGEEGEED